jgi:tape measure domain-containing protein
MTTSIDNKVVTIKFDNEKFNTNVSNTMGLIEKFKAKLNFGGSVKGIDEVNKNVSGVNVGPIGAAIDKFKEKFNFGGSVKGIDDVNKNVGGVNVGPVGSAIDRVKEKLNFGGSVKGIDEVNKAASGVNLNPIGVAIEGINGKFLAMSAIAVTALSTITTKAMSAGAQLTKSLSIGPLMDGFKEYETNMNSIQTILANTDSKGSTLEDVNAALEELNAYSDQTIYNFAEMAKNIGTFTAAGVDLDTSTAAIKGIANLAAISGSNSEQASTAMYQLSQAMSTGVVKAQDWISVTNAGMGGEVFQKALWESGKAMGAFNDIPIDQTFKEWQEASGGFKGSLESGWLTGEILTNTLQGFTGDLTEAQIMSLGYTKEQAAEVMRLGKIGKAAATEVKTITQLFGTIKESIGSGWSQTSKIFLGDFEEAKSLLTDINGSVSGFVGKMADNRNNILSFWKFLGGRDVLIEALGKSLKLILGPLDRLQKAFREFFPRKTGADLAILTLKFKEFVDRVRPTRETLDKLLNVFRGFFAIIRIGIDVIKGIISVIGDIFSAISGAGAGGAVLDLAEKFGLFFVALQKGTLSGETIAAFFSGIGGSIGKVVGVVVELGGKLVSTIATIVTFIGGRLVGAIKTVASVIGGAGSAIFGFFSNLFGKDKDEKADSKDSKAGKLDILKKTIAAFSKVIDGAASVWDAFVNGIKTIGRGVAKVTSTIVDSFSGIGAALGDAFSSGNFDKVINIVKAALLGGIFWQIKKFLQRLLDLDFGGSFIEKLTGIFDELTGVLKAMQTKIKADALMSIAKALGLLTLSLLALSFIDGDKLSKALVATAFGLGQLVAAMVLLEKTTSATDAPKMAIMALGLGLMAGALLLLAVAVRVLATLSWDELFVGMAGVTGLLLAMSLAAKLMSGTSGGLIKTAFVMIGLSVAMLIMAIAIKSIVELDPKRMGFGVLALSASLVVLAAAMRLMGDDKSAAAKGLAMLAIAWSLQKMADAIILFAKIPFQVVKDGLLRIGLALVVLGLSLRAMPDHMPTIALGLVLVSGALYVMSKVIELFGNMKWEVIKQGIGGVAAVMLILALGVNALKDAGKGAVVMIVVAAAMFALFKVIEQFGNMKLSSLITGLLALAAVFVVLGVAAYVIGPMAPALLLLGVAMMAIAASFAIFAAAAWLAAQAFIAVADAGQHGVDTLIAIINALIAALPGFMEQLAIGLGNMAQTFLDQAPKLIESFSTIIGSLLQMLIDNIPKAMEVMSALIAAIIQVVRDNGPNFILMAFELIMAFLQGLRDNMYQITTFAVQILIALIQGLTDNIVQLTDAAVNLITAFLTALSNRLIDIINAGVELLVKFIEGMIENIGDIATAVGKLITRFIDEVFKLYEDIAKAGTDALIEFLAGMTRNLVKIVDAVGTLISEFVRAVGLQASKIAQAGTDALIDFLDALSQDVTRIAGAVTAFIVNLVWALGEQVGPITDGLLEAFVNALNGVADAIRENSSDIRKAILNIADAIIDGLTFGITNNNAFIEAIKKMAGDALDAIKGFFGINSPAKKFIEVGESLAEGLVVALRADKTAAAAAANLGRDVNNSIHSSFGKVTLDLSDVGDFDPVIAPVLDLTQVRKEAGNLAGMFGVSPISPQVSYENAGIIAHTKDTRDDAPAPSTISDPKEVKFEQNIYAPDGLNAGSVYRGTRSQIALAKEELSIP